MPTRACAWAHIYYCFPSPWSGDMFPWPKLLSGKLSLLQSRVSSGLSLRHTGTEKGKTKCFGTRTLKKERRAGRGDKWNRCTCIAHKEAKQRRQCQAHGGACAGAEIFRRLKTVVALRLHIHHRGDCCVCPEERTVWV